MVKKYLDILLIDANIKKLLNINNNEYYNEILKELNISKNSRIVENLLSCPVAEKQRSCSEETLFLDSVGNWINESKNSYVEHTILPGNKNTNYHDLDYRRRMLQENSVFLCSVEKIYDYLKYIITYYYIVELCSVSYEYNVYIKNIYKTEIIVKELDLKSPVNQRNNESEARLEQFHSARGDSVATSLQGIVRNQSLYIEKKVLCEQSKLKENVKSRNNLLSSKLDNEIKNINHTMLNNNIDIKSFYIAETIELLSSYKKILKTP